MMVAIVDIARDPTGACAFSECIGFDCCKTLRLNNSDLWILPHKSVTAQLGPHGRRLRLDEKALITGIKPSSLVPFVSKHDAEKALGNTIPVPLIGTVLAPLLCSWSMMTRQQTMNGGA